MKYSLLNSETEKSVKKSRGIMRFSYAFRWMLIIGITYMIVMIIWNVLSNQPEEEYSPYDDASKNIWENGDRKKVQYPSDAIPQKFRDYCQFLEYPVTGQEGLDVDTTKYKLRSLVILFRHGERSPIGKVKGDLDSLSSTSCTPFHETDRQAFSQYVKMVTSTDFSTFLKTDALLKGFPVHPKYSQCQGGNLTAEGALQHNKIGAFLNSRYRNTQIFDNKKQLRTRIVTSNYTRTFQSAVGMVSAFLYPMRNVTGNLFVERSNYTFLCTSQWCHCPPAPKWRKEMDRQREQYYMHISPQTLQKEALVFQFLKATARTFEPDSFLDKMYGFYICRRRQLPCATNGLCVNYGLLNKLINESTSRSSAMYESTNYNAREVQMAEAYTMIGNVVNAIKQLAKGDGVNEVNLFSGHDVTVSPLLHVLGIPHETQPRYASRVVFELFQLHSSTPQTKVFVRVLFNGGDRTHFIPFCSPLVDGLCDGQNFIDFFENDYWKGLPEYGSLGELCGTAEGKMVDDQ